MRPRLLALATALVLSRAPLASADDSGAALYQRAWAAFLAADYPSAMDLAARAAQSPGPQRQLAKLMYGDALFRTGQHERAKAVYQALLQQAAPADRAGITRRIAAVDRVLGVAPAPAPATPPMSTTGGDAYAAALAAARANDVDAALEHAARAAREQGVHKLDAKVLYGDLLVRRGEYQRAKDVYLAIRRATTGDVRTIVVGKIAAVNRQLRLPETDGLTD